jgi:TonB family protein
MFEFAKPKDRQNKMKYLASSFMSAMVHAVIIGAMIAVPLIFCNPVQPKESLIGIISLPALQTEKTSPAVSPRHINPIELKGGGNEHALKAAIELTAPLNIPDNILPEISAVSPFGDGKIGDGMGKGPGSTLPGTPYGDKMADMIAQFRPIESIPISAPVMPPVSKAPLSPPPPTPPPTPIKTPISVLNPSNLIYKVTPTYPDLALRNKVEGKVVLIADIDEGGNIGNIKVLSGSPILAAAARAAVKQWKYSPTVLNGEPIPVQATVEVFFRLEK